MKNHKFKLISATYVSIIVMVFSFLFILFSKTTFLNGLLKLIQVSFFWFLISFLILFLWEKYAHNSYQILFSIDDNHQNVTKINNSLDIASNYKGSKIDVTESTNELNYLEEFLKESDKKTKETLPSDQSNNLNSELVKQLDVSSGKNTKTEPEELTDLDRKDNNELTKINMNKINQKLKGTDSKEIAKSIQTMINKNEI